MKPAAWISLPTGFALALTATSFSAAVPRHPGKASSRSMASVPNLDIKPSCRQSSVPDCLTEEDFARKALVEQWPKFTRQQKARCAVEATYAGPPSYVGWLTCLTINADADKVPAGTRAGCRQRGGGHRRHRRHHSGTWGTERHAKHQQWGCGRHRRGRRKIEIRQHRLSFTLAMHSCRDLSLSAPAQREFDNRIKYRAPDHHKNGPYHIIDVLLEISKGLRFGQAPLEDRSQEENDGRCGDNDSNQLEHRERAPASAPGMVDRIEACLNPRVKAPLPHRRIAGSIPEITENDRLNEGRPLIRSGLRPFHPLPPPPSPAIAYEASL